MKNRFCFILLGAFVMMLAGCSRTARLYPVQGPLSAEASPPILVAKVTGLMSGSVSVVLSNGEMCKGHWALVPRAHAGSGGSSPSAPADDMSSAWDAVYGPGFYVAHVLGSRLYGRAVVSGNRGTVFDVEMYQRENTDNVPAAVQGVAKDNGGNIYKLVIG